MARSVSTSDCQPLNRTIQCGRELSAHLCSHVVLILAFQACCGLLPFTCVTALAPWPMYGQNPSHSRTHIPLDPLVPTNKQNWTFDVSGWVYAAPCVAADESIYLTSWDGYLYAVNPDGSQRWRFLVHEKQQLWASPALAPSDTTSNVTVYIGGNESLIAIRHTAQFGTVVLWSVATGWPVLASPTVGDNGVIYFGDLGGVLRAVNPSTGHVAWSVSRINNVTIGPIYASAAVTNTSMFVATMHGKVLSIDSLTGTPQWVVNSSKSPITSSPSLSHDGQLIYVASQDGFLRALDQTNGSLVWQYKVGVIDGSSPAVSTVDGTVYIGSLDKHLYAINTNGTLRWKLLSDSPIQSSPAIGAQGVVYFCSFGGTMYGVHPNATVKWTAALGGTTFSSPALGNQGLYIGSNGGFLKAFV
eukprot:m.14402 g.14402  ORF g.14402 m.14402 type:complete len:415 (+) comp10111_c1_seq1:153-1397(+)